MFEGEEWKPIDEFPHYLVSTHGRVKHVDRINARRVSINERGFPVILLSSATSATRYMRQINQLVARAFLEPSEDPLETSVWHIDGDLKNCHYTNLRWATRPRVLEWNEMHRLGQSKYNTPKVKNNRTGEVYRDAFECAIHEGRTETDIIYILDYGTGSLYDESVLYRYAPELPVTVF